MSKPLLTSEQKAKAEQAIRDIFQKAPEEVLRQWDRNVQWMPGSEMPLLQYGIARKLPAKLRDEYVNLTNKIKNRSI